MKKKILLPVTAILILIIAVIATVLYVRTASAQKKNDALLADSEYNCVFLSMYPISTYDPEDFSHYRADDVLLLDDCIPNFKTMQRYLKDVKLSENEMHCIYLGVDPKKVTAEQILECKEAFPGVTFLIIPTYRRLSEWMKDRHPEKTFNAYLDLTQKLLEKDEIQVYSFFAQEWLIADDANYVKGNLLNKGVAQKVYIYADVKHNCNFLPENIAVVFDTFSKLLSDVHENGYRFPSFKNLDVIFFGDSVIGNYTGHDSIPGLVADFTGARTYNIGWGGAAATGERVSDARSIIGAYLAKDPSILAENENASQNLSRRLSDEENSSGRDLLIVLHFGLNDYFVGAPVENWSDPKDITTYAGAMRSLIETLQVNRPDAKLLLIAPNAVTDHKQGFAVQGEGGTLDEYVEVLVRIGEEYGIPVQNNFTDVLPLQGVAKFLDGEVHPNEYGRYKIAKELISNIEKLMR